ncbi:unnamed protein product [Coffea canephora]|uniref:DH200=94 genomic scaffold, scaffold_67 n=1 Tax=Coffea canephora TaxID=49390 RepID=A0A068UVD2_COFCA|nr:unnamed protein product [Coffea canephora]
MLCMDIMLCRLQKSVFVYIFLYVFRLCRAMGGVERKVEIEWGNHVVSSRVQEAVQAILNFVKREGPKGWDDPWS